MNRIAEQIILVISSMLGCMAIMMILEVLGAPSFFSIIVGGGFAYISSKGCVNAWWFHKIFDKIMANDTLKHYLQKEFDKEFKNVDAD